MIKRYFLVLMFLVMGSGAVFGQTTIAMQDFDATNTMTYTASGGTTYTGSSASGDRPASSNFYTSNSTAYGVSNATSILIFSNVSSLSGYTSKYFEFRLASWSISSISNGADGGDSVTVQISTDGGTTWSKEVKVAGNSNAYWHYSTGTGNATVTFDGDDTPTSFAPASGGNRTTDGYSTVKVNIPDAATQARIVISMINNSANERWTIDDVKLVGTLSATPSITLADNGTQISVDNVDQGATDHILSTFKVTVADADATLNSLTFNAGGTFVAGDITNFELFTNTTNTFPGGTALKSVSAGSISAGESVSFTSLSQACNIGDRYFWITADVSGSATASNTVNVPSLSNTNFSFASGTVSGTITAGGAQTIQEVTPSIALSSPTATDEDITIGNNNNVIYRFDLAVTVANATLNGVTITTSGTYSASDLTNLKCWYSADNTFNAGSDVLLSTKTTSLGAGSQAFPSFTSQTINSGSTGYIFITTDLPYTATPSVTISVNAITTGDISFVSGTKSGTANASGTKTLIDCTPTNVTGASATAGDAQVTVSFTLPSCYTEVMIVAKPTSSVSATPSGDGSAYTANLTFGSGTAFDGTGYVVYKGTTSPQTITGLTNGTTYYFKIFTRRGSSWSDGSEVNATPVAAELLLEENFGYTAGTDLNGQGSWTLIGTNGTDLLVSSAGLSYTGYPSSGGNAADITSSRADDLGKAFSTKSSGVLYYSFLVKVTGASGSGTYFTGFNTTATATNYSGRVFAKIASGNVNFGLSKSTETETYSTTNYSTSTTYLLVLKYEFIAGTNNDKVSLFIFSSPTLPASEPGTPDIGPLTPSNGDNSSLGAVFLRQASGIPDLTIDGQRISTGWGEAPLPVELTSFSAKSVKGGVALTWQTATEVNNYGFEIQRSGNRDQETGNSWEVIGFVAGNGNSNSEKSYSFTDRNVANATKYIYRLKQIDTDGKFDYSKEVEVTTGMPERFELAQNYPNPFNPTTVISYQLTQAGNVKLTVFDILGKEVATLVNGKMDAGSHTVNFNALGLQSGIYFYKLTVTGENGSLLYNSTNKMSLIK